ITQIGNQSSGAHALAIQPDGKIVVAGYENVSGGMGAVRYTATGQLDPSFGTSGIVTGVMPGQTGSAASSVLILDNGKIILGGGYLARLTSTGQLDTTFGSAGFAFSSGFGYATAVALGANGDLLAASTTPNRYDNNGQIAQWAHPAVTAFLPSGALD